MRLRAFALATLALLLLGAGPALAQTSVIVRKPDNSAAIDVANAANQTAPQANAGSDASKAVAVQGLTGGKPVPVSATSLPLPTGASTSAAQATANGSLSSIDGKTPALGQANKASSVPVTLPTDPDIRSATSNITAADVATTTTTGQNGAQIVTGAPTANSSIVWTLNGQSSATMLVTGTFVASADIETSADCSTYGKAGGKVLGHKLPTGTVTAPGTFRIDATGMACVRLHATAYTSGTLTAQLVSSAAPGLTQVINPVGIFPAMVTPLGYTQVTSLSAAAGLGTIPAGTVYAVISPESQVVRWRDDGTNPTASVGMELYPGQAMTYSGTFTALKFIEETASAKLNITFYK